MLDEELMSSEDEEIVEGEIKFVIRPLPWISPEVRTAFKRLDASYIKNISEWDMKKRRPRALGPESGRLPTNKDSLQQFVIDL